MSDISSDLKPDISSDIKPDISSDIKPDIKADIKANASVKNESTSAIVRMLASRSKLDITWGILMVVTLLNALVAETAEPHLLITFIICLSIAYKGRLVIDNFMELYNANNTIRSLMRSYFYIFPALIFLADAFSEQIALFTTIS